MNPQLMNYLQFNGKNLYVLAKDGNTYVAVKPICEALGVDYIQQFKNLKDDEILSQLLCNHTMVAADGKMREMVCLPEKYVYGWLFGIRSDSPELKAYKLACYDLLYDHFHGVMSQRLQVLREKTAAELEVEKWTAELEQTEAYQNLLKAKSVVKEANQRRNQLDQLLATSQTSLFDE